MRISLSVNESKKHFMDYEVKNLKDIANLALKYNYSLSTFKLEQRSLTNFEQTELIGIDIDNGQNEHQLTLADAQEQFSDYAHIILTSKSHQKEKHGRTVDRFRIILKLESPITDAATFRATWHALKASCPAMDAQCKDASRFWFKSPSIVSVQESGKLIPLATAKTPKPQKQYNFEIDPGRKGTPSQSTMNFIAKGAPPGQWNHSLYRAAKDLQQQLYTEDQAVTMLTIPTQLTGNSGSLDERDIETIQSAFRAKNKYAPRFSDKENTKAIIERCHLIVDLNDIDHTHLVDLETGERFNNISRRAIKELLGPKAFAKFMEDKSIHANFLYDPFTKSLVFRQLNGIPGYNTYTPPSWFLKTFYSSNSTSDPDPTEIETIKTLPPVLDEFINHLTDNDSESRAYLFDWLHTAMLSRNYTMLTAIGEQGIGKGVLGTIMSKLVGGSNYVQTRDEIFKKSFNKQLEGKRLVYVDELALNKKEAHDRMKHMVNETLEIEGKGKDSIYIENYASFYLSSNHFDAIQLQPGDRRFSIIQLTDKRLLEHFTHDQIQNGILGPNTIKTFGHYLLSRKVERDMRIPFKSERFNEVLDASLKSWQRFILETLHNQYSGNRLDLNELKDKLKTEFPNLTPPGRGKLQALTKSYPEKLKWVNGKDSRFIEFIG